MMIRVFPRKTAMSPSDDLAFFDEPGLFRPPDQPVYVSVVFTWDMERGERLYRAWSDHYSNVKIGGPAYGDPGGEFTPGRFLRRGITITSRGCDKMCDFCFVPEREGGIRELTIEPGNEIQDNNILACSERHIRAVFKMLREQKKVRFSGGLDLRLLMDWHIDELLTLPSLSTMFFACDSDADIEMLGDNHKRLSPFSQNKKQCYVLFDPDRDTIEKADARARKVYEFGFLPFAQYKRTTLNDKATGDWAKLTRYWSRPAIYKKAESAPPL